MRKIWKDWDSRCEPSENGRPNYSANLLLKVWLYGYVTKIRSNRGLERACLESIGMLWLSGMQSPDHTTLFRFWRDNQKAIRKLFKQLLQVAVSLDLVGMVLHAVDGTKILSSASDYKAWHRKSLEERMKKLDGAIDEIMKETERSSETAAECRLPEGLKERQELRAKIEKQLKQLNEKDRDHLQPGDEGARMMKCRKGTKFAYNAQAVVDQDSKLIVAANVVSDESDNYQLVPMLEQTEQNLGGVAEQTVADNGYQATTQAAKAEEKSYSILVNLNEPDDQPYHASRFTYDAKNDRCICPRGEMLEFDGIKKRDRVQPYAVRVYRCGNYENCLVRWQCSKSQSGRTVQIHPHHDVLLRQREKLKGEPMRALLKRRGAIIEPLFGWIKGPLGFRRWTVRGLEKVRTQWSLLCTAINLRRLQSKWAAGKLVFQ